MKSEGIYQPGKSETGEKKENMSVWKEGRMELGQVDMKNSRAKKFIRATG